jgi:hypothetical protein
MIQRVKTVADSEGLMHERSQRKLFKQQMVAAKIVQYVRRHLSNTKFNPNAFSDRRDAPYGMPGHGSHSRSDGAANLYSAVSLLKLQQRITKSIGSMYVDLLRNHDL